MQTPMGQPNFTDAFLPGSRGLAKPDRVCRTVVVNQGSGSGDSSFAAVESRVRNSHQFRYEKCPRARRVNEDYAPLAKR